MAEEPAQAVADPGLASKRLPSVRMQVRRKLSDALREQWHALKASGDSIGEVRDPTDLACEIEEALHSQLWSESERQYTTQARSLIFNVNSSANAALRLRILLGSLSP